MEQKFSFSESDSNPAVSTPPEEVSSETISDNQETAIIAVDSTDETISNRNSFPTPATYPPRRHQKLSVAKTAADNENSDKENVAPSLKDRKLPFGAAIIVVLLLVAVVIGVTQVVKIWSASGHPNGSLSNGIVPAWEKPTTIKVPTASDDFYPYTVYASDQEAFYTISPFKKKAVYYEVDPQQGKVSKESRNLSPCAFNAGNRYLYQEGALSCETYRPLKAKPSENATDSDENFGESIYTENNFEIRVNPHNGKDAKQIIGYRDDKPLWLVDLPQGGYVTVENNMVLVTQQLSATKISVTAYRPSEKPVAPPKANQIRQINPKAILKLDFKNLIIPTEQANCPATQITVGNSVPTIPNHEGNDGCWIKLTAGSHEAGPTPPPGAPTSASGSNTSAPATSSPNSPDYTIPSSLPGNWIGKGLGKWDSDRGISLVDLNHDGYLDAIMPVQKTEKETKTTPVYDEEYQEYANRTETVDRSIFYWVALIYQPAHPLTPGSLILYSQPTTTPVGIFQFQNEVLEYLPSPNAAPSLHLKFNNLDEVATVSELERISSPGTSAVSPGDTATAGNQPSTQKPRVRKIIRRYIVTVPPGQPLPEGYTPVPQQ